MDTITNENVLRRRYFLATTLTVSGLILLLLSSLLLFTFPSAISTLPLLPIGTIAAIAGLRITNTWLRNPAPHTAINTALKGFGKGNLLIHYATPATHLLISQHGIFSITALPHPTHVTIQHKQWESADNIATSFQLALGYPRITDPLAAAHKEADQATHWLQQALHTNDIQVNPVITLTSPNATLAIITDPPIPITTTTKTRYSLKNHLRNQHNPTLSHAQIEQLIQLLKYRRPG